MAESEDRMSNGSQALARITPAQRMLTVPGTPNAVRSLGPREKAAIIVRFLLAEGAKIPLTQLPEHMQTALAEQMGAMRMIDRQTLDAVVAEFLEQLESVGLAFPGGLEGALSVMDGHISQSTASRLRRKAGVTSKTDPWERLVALTTTEIMPVLEEESVEVAAVILSKLPVPKAADLLGKLPGEKARRIAFAVSQTGNIDPETVRRIGAAVLNQLDSKPVKAFETGPVERVGAILNISPALTREDVLQGLEAEDAAFAERVRKAIFTYTHIPKRVAPRDVPKILRMVDQKIVVTAMAASSGKPDLEETTEFILANISQRMAQGLREEMGARGKVKDKDGEEAMNLIITGIRELEATGEMLLIQEEEEG